MKRLELGNVLLLKLLGQRKSRSTRNGTNTKTVPRSICKPRGGRSVWRAISPILECEERKHLVQRPLRTTFGMLPHLLHNTAMTILHEGHQHDRKRLEELQTPLVERSQVEGHQQLIRISFRRLRLLHQESRLCKHILQHHQLTQSLCAQSPFLVDRKLRTTLDMSPFLLCLEQQLSSLGIEDAIEVVAD
jgi:hypothetical protein